MKNIYTIYLAARDTHGGKITVEDFQEIQEIVEETSKTCTIFMANGFRGGRAEEMAVIVVALENNKKAGERIKACCNRLLAAFEKSSILCEFSKGMALGGGALERAKGDVIGDGQKNAERTDWAKKVIDSVKHKPTQKELKRSHAIPKLQKLKNDNPDAKIEDGQELLKKEFPKLAPNIP